MKKTLSNCLAAVALITVCYAVVQLWTLNAQHVREKQAHDARLQQVLKAVDEGRSLGPPPPNDPARFIEPKIVAAGKEQREGGDRYAAQQKFMETQEEIKALAESPRKEQLLYTLASYQAQGGLYDDMDRTVNLMTDPEKRIGFLIAAGSNHVREPEPARRRLLTAAIEIAQVPDQAKRDSLYAQLAFAQKTRGLIDDQRITCNQISSPEQKNSVPCPH